MERIAHAYTTRDEWLAHRRRNLNSTDIAALFGLSPYMTALELALTKAGKIDEADVENDRTAWGRRLQDAIAGGVAEEHGVVVAPRTGYVEMIPLRLGSSFDFQVVAAQAITVAPIDNPLVNFFQSRGAGLLEIKNLDPRAFFNDWQVYDGQLEAAPHIELQLQHQMLVSGLKWGAIAALIGGNTLKIIVRDYDPDIGEDILVRAFRFWQDLDAGKYPPAKLPPDAAILAKLYNFSEPGTFYDGTGDEALATACELYNQAAARAKNAEDEKDCARAEVLQIIRDNEKAVTAGYKISTWMVPPTPVSFERPGFRSMRITKIRVKEAK